MTVRSTQPVTVTWHPQATQGRAMPAAKGQCSPDLSPQHSRSHHELNILVWMRHRLVGKR